MLLSLRTNGLKDSLFKGGGAYAYKNPGAGGCKIYTTTRLPSALKMPYGQKWGGGAYIISPWVRNLVLEEDKRATTNVQHGPLHGLVFFFFILCKKALILRKVLGENSE